MLVSLQLMILLYQISYYGNTVGIRHITNWSGVSIGMVYNCFAQVFIVLTFFNAMLIHWPNNIEKKQAKEYVERKSSCNAWHNDYVDRLSSGQGQNQTNNSIRLSGVKV